MCDFGPTLWTDDLRPPQYIHVLRSQGPNAGRVEKVPFWTYVGTVLRAEYSTGSDKPAPWMTIGALTVKQYGWYYARYWRGAKKNFYDSNGALIRTECFDVKDTTADQLYKPERWDATLGAWVPKNVPWASAANLKAMRETWHISMRKWHKTNQTRMYLSGYRSGIRKPCGADSTGFKIFQKSLRDCGVKGLTFEEVVREYFEPSFLVDARGHDVLSDSGAWRGETGVVTDTGQWRMYSAKTDMTGFDSNVVNGALGVNVKAAGLGNVNAADANGAADDKMLADLVVLTQNGTLQVARSNGTTFTAPVANPVAPPAADRFVVADFNGDFMSDAGFVTFNGGTATLKVMLRSADGAQFNGAVDWWSGPVGADAFVAAGDVNGDGKADLVTRDATTGAYSTAISRATCTNLSVWGACPAGAISSVGLAALNAAGDPPLALDARNTLGDFDRDGRDDVYSVVPDGPNSVKVYVLRGRADGLLGDPQLLGTFSGISSTNMRVQAFNANWDSMDDLAIFSGGKVTLLRTVERTTVPASMVVAGSLTDAGMPASGFEAF